MSFKQRLSAWNQFDNRTAAGDKWGDLITETAQRFIGMVLKESKARSSRFGSIFLVTSKNAYRFEYLSTGTVYYINVDIRAEELIRNNTLTVYVSLKATGGSHVSTTVLKVPCSAYNTPGSIAEEIFKRTVYWIENEAD